MFLHLRGRPDAFFRAVLPGRETALDAPGGATQLGQTGVDTPMIAALELRYA